MNRKKINFYFLFLSMFVSSKSFSYSNFISHGYTSCLTCHYNALGDGPLNDYGRAVSATAIASKVFYSKNSDDQYLSDHSNFFFGKWKDQKWLRPSLNVRGMRYTRNFTKGNEVSRNILMQADGNIVLRPAEKDKFFISASYGYAPTPLATKGSSSKSQAEQKNVISREHYMQVTIAKNHRLYLGFMDKAFGLRIPDHVAFSRTATGLAQNDQSHGVVHHYYNKNFEVATNFFVGNLNQDKSLRQVGGSMTGEYEFDVKSRIGASVLVSQNDYVKNLFNSFQLRLGFGEGASIISEIGQVTKTPIKSELKKTTGIYSFFQGALTLVRGSEILTTFEYYKSDISTSSSNTNYRFGLGYQFFPFQRMEWRFDLVNSRIISTSTVVLDSLDLMSQVHLWF